MKYIFVVFLLIFLSVSCNPIEKLNVSSDFTTSGSVLVINEGNYNWQNGSISIIYPDSQSTVNEAYSLVNKTNLGDVPQSALIHNDNIYILVNNSGKIVKLDKNSLKLLDEIEGFVSPRYIVEKNNIAYVSDLYSSTISILDLDNFSVIEQISTPKSTEQMLILGNKLFIANWAAGNKLLILDTESNLFTDTILLVEEPQSMVLDKNDDLWVLCSGGFTSIDYPALFCISTQNNEIKYQFNFSSKTFSPTNLCINPTKDTLYYINESVFRMAITDECLPSDVFIEKESQIFYGLAISPDNKIWLSDANDFVENSNVAVYFTDTKLFASYMLGVNASHFYFLP